MKTPVLTLIVAGFVLNTALAGLVPVGVPDVTLRLGKSRHADKGSAPPGPKLSFPVKTPRDNRIAAR